MTRDSSLYGTRITGIFDGYGTRITSILDGYAARITRILDGYAARITRILEVTGRGLRGFSELLTE
jgi:hypothetical protein